MKNSIKINMLKFDKKKLFSEILFKFFVMKLHLKI